MISPVSAVGYPKAEEVLIRDFKKLAHELRPELISITGDNNSIYVDFKFLDSETRHTSILYLSQPIFSKSNIWRRKNGTRSVYKSDRRK